jgi:hypothetical protein
MPAVASAHVPGDRRPGGPLAHATVHVDVGFTGLVCLVLGVGQHRAGLTAEYKRMFEDSRLTGIFDRETLQKVARATGARYLAQLKLGGFRQESKGRRGTLGLRMLETKSANIRLFLQIWDSQDGSVVWEGSQELTLAYESLAEEAVSLQRAVEASAREFVARRRRPRFPEMSPAIGNATRPRGICRCSARP